MCSHIWISGLVYRYLYLLSMFQMRAYFDTYEVFFEENLPQLFCHFKEQNLTPDLYIIDWMFTLYAKSLPLDVASRVWDVFCRDGEEFLFRTALGENAVLGFVLIARLRTDYWIRCRVWDVLSR